MKEKYALLPKPGDVLKYEEPQGYQDAYTPYYYLYLDQGRIVNLANGKILNHNVFGESWSVVCSEVVK